MKQRNIFKFIQRSLLHASNLILMNKKRVPGHQCIFYVILLHSTLYFSNTCLSVWQSFLKLKIKKVCELVNVEKLQEQIHLTLSILRKIFLSEKVLNDNFKLFFKLYIKIVWSDIGTAVMKLIPC